MHHVHNFLQFFFGGIGDLVHLILQNLRGVIQWRDALFRFLQVFADIAEGFFIGKAVTRPAFLIVHFETDPFLAQAVFCKALHFGHFVDAAFEFCVEFEIGFLRSFCAAQSFVQTLYVTIEACRFFLEGVVFFLPFLPGAVAVNLRDGLLFEEGGLCLFAFQFRCDQIRETIFNIAQAVGGHGVFVAVLIHAFADGGQFTLNIGNMFQVVLACFVHGFQGMQDIFVGACGLVNMCFEIAHVVSHALHFICRVL